MGTWRGTLGRCAPTEGLGGQAPDGPQGAPGPADNLSRTPGTGRRPLGFSRVTSISDDFQFTLSVTVPNSPATRTSLRLKLSLTS